MYRARRQANSGPHADGCHSTLATYHGVFPLPHCRCHRGGNNCFHEPFDSKMIDHYPAKKFIEILNITPMLDCMLTLLWSEKQSESLNVLELPFWLKTPRLVRWEISTVHEET